MKTFSENIFKLVALNFSREIKKCRTFDFMFTGRPSSGQSYRESLGETGIRLPSRAIERLVSAYEKEQASKYFKV